MDQKVNLHNRFDIEVRDSRTGKLRQKAFAENIILNQAWAQILAEQSWFTTIYYGTGTGTISAARTALFTPLSSKTTTGQVFNEDIVSNYFSLRQSIVILENEHVGSSLSEVGIGTATVLCTHALLKDMNGNPVTIVKTSTDIITIYATVYLQPTNVSSDTAGIDFCRGGVETNPLLRGLLGSLYSSYSAYSYRLLAGMGEEPWAPVAYTSGRIAATIDAANKKVTWYHRIPAASGNTGGLKEYTLQGYAYIVSAYCYADSIIGRLNEATLTQSPIVEQIGTGDGTTTDFSTTFPFVETGAVIKVDDVAASPTVHYGKPNKKDISGFIRRKTDEEQPQKPFFRFQNYAADIIENPLYSEFGLTSVVFLNGSATFESSDDASTWTSFTLTSLGSGEYSLPGAHQKKRYYRITPTVGGINISSFNSTDADGFKNVRFASAPANGAVITAEYSCDCAAKDVNHVLDISVTIQLGEYTP